MLPSTKRLTTVLFRDVVLHGKHLHSPLFIMRAMTFTGKSRFSVSVPKKVAKNAVMRNKIRRRVYSALAPLFPLIKDGIYGVFIVKPAILDSTFSDISIEMKNFFGKYGFLK